MKIAKAHVCRSWLLLASVVAVLAVPALSRAQDWVWLGSSSTNWSDLANWNSAFDGSGSAPASTADFINKRLLLLTTGVNLPSHQDISGLAVNELQFTNTVTSFDIYGLPIQINNRIYNTVNPAANQFVTFWNQLVLNTSNAWDIKSKLYLNLRGGLAETGGSRYFQANGNGFIRFYGPVTITGGFRNNQAVAGFYGAETTGTWPAALDPDYFYTGFGQMAFNSPGGNDYDYVFGPTVGGQSSGTLALSVVAPATVTFLAPISESAAKKAVQKWGTGVLYLAGTNTLTGGISLSDGMVVLQGPFAAGDGTVNLSSAAGAIDLNGFDVLGRNLTFANSSGFTESGVLRNSNRGQASTINGNMTTVANDPAIIQFGGAGDILYSGNITHAISSYRLAKTGAGTLTMKGNSVYTGTLQALGGKVVLDYTADNGSKVGDTATVNLHGDLTVTGNTSAPTVETVGPLSIGNLNNVERNRCRIAVAGSGGQTAALRFSTLNVRGDNSVDFAPGSGGAIQTTGATNIPAVGICGVRMTYNGSSYARIGGTAVGGYYPVEALPDGAYATSWDSGTLFELVDVAGAMSVASAETVAALRFNDGSGASTLTLDAPLNVLGENGTNNPSQGAVLVTPNVGAHATLIDGSGTLAANGLNGWLHVHQYNAAAPLTIAARIFSSSAGTALSKSGPGELILTNGQNTFSDLAIYEGTVTVASITNNGAMSAAGFGGNTHLGTATLKYTGAGDQTDRLIILRGHGMIDASGTGPLVFTRTTTVASDEGNDHVLTLTGSGVGEMQGVLNLKVGALRKAGSGTWTLGPLSTNSFWGGASVEAGTLVVNGSVGRDVTVAAGGTLAGTGKIGHHLTVRGTLAADPSAGALTVAKNVTLDGATLAVTGAVGTDPVVILTAGGTVTGTFANVPQQYEILYTGDSVLVRKRFTGTVISVQ